jgi:hypothetical protein
VATIVLDESRENRIRPEASMAVSLAVKGWKKKFLNVPVWDRT